MTTETRALGDDHELVARARHGDQEAFSTLVERYRELACRAAFVVLGNAADAEDAAQDAFAKAYLALRQLSSETPFRPWLLRIVTNEARNLRTAARRRSRRTEIAGSDELRSSVAASAEIDALATERREELLKGLLLLREDDRLVITYRYLFDLPEAETSEALGWARGTVKSRLSRAIQRLREELRDRARCSSWCPISGRCFGAGVGNLDSIQSGGALARRSGRRCLPE